MLRSGRGQPYYAGHDPPINFLHLPTSAIPSRPQVGAEGQAIGGQGKVMWLSRWDTTCINLTEKEGFDLWVQPILPRVLCIKN